MLKKEDLKDLSEQELKARVIDLSKEIYALKNELSIARKLEKPHLLREKKRDRARVLTMLSQKE